MSEHKPFDLFEPELQSPHDHTLAHVAQRLSESPLFCFALVLAVTRGRPLDDGGIHVDLLATAKGANNPALLRFVAQQIRERTAPELEARAAALESVAVISANTRLGQEPIGTPPADLGGGHPSDVLAGHERTKRAGEGD